MIEVLKEMLKILFRNWLFLTLMVSPIFIMEMTDFSLVVKYAFNILVVPFIILIVFIKLLNNGDFSKLKSLKLVLKFWAIMVLTCLMLNAFGKMIGNTVNDIYIWLGFDFMFERIEYYVLAMSIPVVFITLYVVLRVFVVAPMIVMGDEISLKKIYDFSKESYLSWILVALIVITPFFFMFCYAFQEQLIYAIFDSILTALFCCFYTAYYKEKLKKTYEQKK